MLSHLQRGFRLGPWKVEPLRGAVSGPEGEDRHLEPKVMEVFVLLAEQANQLVTRDQLLDKVWSRHVAADQLLTRAISELRRALHDSRGDPVAIETVPKRGYRLVGDVRPLEDGEALPITVSPPSGYRTGGLARAAVIAFGLVLGVGWLLYDRFGADRAEDQPQVAEPIDDPAMSIAVLPFANMSQDIDNEYFSDGLSEEIRNLLAEIPDSKVIGRASSFAFKGKNEDLRAIGRILGVKTILDGSVRKSGDRMRITAQLIDASDGSQIWTGAYRRTMTDVFELQDELAAAIIDALQLHIGAHPTRGRPTEIADAYVLLLKARAALNDADATTAAALLKQAVDLDPKFAEAYELLAHVYWTDSIPEIDGAGSQSLMRDAAAKALSIDPDLDLAPVFFLEGNAENYSLPDVFVAQSRALRRQPANPVTLRIVSWNLLMAGYVREALSVAERFVELDPLSSMAHARHSAALKAAGPPGEDMPSLQTAHQLSSRGLHWTLGEEYLSRSMDDRAQEHFEAAMRQVGATDVTWIAKLLDGARDPVSGEAHLDQQIPASLAAASVANELSQDDLNRLYLHLGYLDRYYELILERDSEFSPWSSAVYLVWWGTIDRHRGFTAHPRYIELAERMGFVDLWERRGPPDFCEKVKRKWVCE